MAGALALVVGPSGAGKDTLIAEARVVLAHNPRFVFVRRMVTRDAVAEVEDHDTISRDAFAEGLRRGMFALSWEAHGLGYGLPVALGEEMARGRTVVANVSRRVVPEAATRFGNVRVLSIEATPEVRAARLGARGREDAAAIAARLAREGSALPAGVPVVAIDNSGSLADGVAAFVAALRAMVGEPGRGAS